VYYLEVPHLGQDWVLALGVLQSISRAMAHLVRRRRGPTHRLVGTGRLLFLRRGLGPA